MTGAATAGLRLGGVGVRAGRGRLSAGAVSTALPASPDLRDRHDLAIEVRGRRRHARPVPPRRPGRPGVAAAAAPRDG
ncbi:MULTISPECIES: hypothetical protein [unclassified Micromonospora]|uniref:hypothetical protein n=1 Tax=unclassified Micromonospora TaxID=2617518 RepID=UPI0022B641FA|nr:MULTISPECIES: hypothetical protein [unclassified Micromonospora]MCZ7475759.1 hypothetical protein [Micromonospora sp. WMMC273]WBC00627.1 hypothetical protein O7546_15740 [Micromonospora sp. WMMA1976]